MAAVALKSSYASTGPIMTKHESGNQSNLESGSDSCLSKARSIIKAAISEANSDLLKINQGLHSNPEVGYQEHFAHESITNYLSSTGFAVKRHTYGLETSFEAEFGSEGRLVIICAEYDALPGIGHSCGHNLIATSSIATFIAAAKAMEMCGIKGRLKLLGTPAEEGGGGKAKLIDAGAFPEETSLSLMCHPMTGHGLFHQPEKYQGLAGLRLIASHKFHVEFRGKSAHAAGEPWNGVNALDAAVTAYTSVSLLRQQIEPDERIHCVIEDGGTVPNIITEYTRMCWNVRSPTIEKADKLLKRVRQCIEAAGLSTGCKVDFKFSPTYMNLRVNDTLCKTYAHEMSLVGSNIMVHQEKSANASTDMGNVSHTVPSFHGAFSIPTTKDVSIHNPSFASCAGTVEAHEAALRCAEGMAALALRVMTDDDIAHRARLDFEKKDE